MSNHLPHSADNLESPTTNRRTHERDEHGWMLGIRRNLAVIATASIVALASTCSTEKEQKTISGTAALSDVTVKYLKACFWEYGTDVAGVGEKRSTQAKLLGWDLGPFKKLAEISAQTTFTGPLDSEACYTNFLVEPKIDDKTGDIELVLSDKASLEVSTEPANPTTPGTYEAKRSPLIDQKRLYESFANGIGFDEVDDIADLEAIMIDRANESSAYRALDCLDEAQALAEPYLKEEIAKQWVDTASGFAKEKGLDVELTEEDVKDVKLPPIPDKDELSDYQKNIDKVAKKKDITVIKGTTTKCDAGNAVVVQEASDE